jgi:hypothetical protein
MSPYTNAALLIWLKPSSQLKGRQDECATRGLNMHGVSVAEIRNKKCDLLANSESRVAPQKTPRLEFANRPFSALLSPIRIRHGL